MARKRRAPSPPPPPPPPPQQSSSSEESGSDTEGEEEVWPRATAAQMPPKNPQPRAPAAAADGADSSSSEEDESDPDADGQASQMRPVSRSATKAAAAAAAPQPESDADEEEEEEDEEEGNSDESEPEVPELVKKAAATNKSKTAEPQIKKRPAPEPAPSGKAKKAKAEAGKVALPEATPAGKGKKAKVELEKAAPVQSPSGKTKKPGGKLEKTGLDSSPSSKSARAQRFWSKEDVIRILEVLAGHVKKEGVLPKADFVLAAVHDHLDRKNCSHTDMYEKIRGLKKRFDKIVNTGVMPSGEDELKTHNLSDAIWGEKATDAIAAVAASRNDDTAVTKSKNRQSRKEKVDGNSKDGVLKEAANDTQRGSKQQGNGKGLRKDAKSGTSKETTTTATRNGSCLTTHKRGKVDKDKMDIDLMPKDVSNDNLNGDTRTEEETREEAEKGASLQGTIRSLDELQKLYPNLASCVERIGAQNPCGDTLKSGFGFIDNDKANALESKIKLQRLSCVKVQISGVGFKKEVVNKLIRLAD